MAMQDEGDQAVQDRRTAVWHKVDAREYPRPHPFDEELEDVVQKLLLGHTKNSSTFVWALPVDGMVDWQHLHQAVCAQMGNVPLLTMQGVVANTKQRIGRFAAHRYWMGWNEVDGPNRVFVCCFSKHKGVVDPPQAVRDWYRDNTDKAEPASWDTRVSGGWYQRIERIKELAEARR